MALWIAGMVAMGAGPGDWPVAMLSGIVIFGILVGLLYRSYYGTVTR